MCQLLTKNTKKAMVDVDQVEKGRMVDVDHEKGRMVDVDQVELVVDVDHCLFHGRRQAALFVTPWIRLKRFLAEFDFSYGHHYNTL